MMSIRDDYDGCQIAGGVRIIFVGFDIIGMESSRLARFTGAVEVEAAAIIVTVAVDASCMSSACWLVMANGVLFIFRFKSRKTSRQKVRSLLAGKL